MKVCGRCKKRKPLTEFFKDKSKPSGLMYRCKECDRIHRKASRARHPETNVARGKRYYANHKEQKKLYLEKWRAKNWFKTNAHMAVRKALRAGILTKENCFCGKQAEAHHDDYTKPLVVRWLCKSHHRDVH